MWKCEENLNKYENNSLPAVIRRSKSSRAKFPNVGVGVLCWSGSGTTSGPMYGEVKRESRNRTSVVQAFPWERRV